MAIADMMAAVWAVIMGKGGVGKTKLTQALAINAALEGKTVVVIDLDANPGITDTFSLYAGQRGERDIVARALRDPDEYSVNRLLLNPERGIAGIALQYPLADAIRELPSAERYPDCGVEVGTLIDRTLRAYNIDMHHLGELLLIPNAGTFDGILAQLADMKARNRSFDMYGILRRALPAICDHFAREWGKPIDLILLDCAGARDALTRIALGAATHVISPFDTNRLALGGLIRTIQDVKEAQRQRGGVSPWLYAPVVNYWKPGKTASSVDAWLEKNAIPALAPLGVTINPVRIPYSENMHQAPQMGTLDWEYDPCDPMMLAVRDIYRAARGNLYGN